MLKKSGRDQFMQTIKYLGDSDFVCEKGHFSYTYFNSLDRFEETSLPEKSKFYNDLTEIKISDRDYEHAQAAWHYFGMRTSKDYHDFYMKSDVMLLRIASRVSARQRFPHTVWTAFTSPRCPP